MSSQPRFKTALRGYDCSEVDKLAARIELSLHHPSSPGAVTPDEIENAEFKVVMLGYDEGEVDDYLDAMIKQLSEAGGSGSQENAIPDPPDLPSLSVHPRGHRFATGLAKAYRTSDVDAYIERVEATVNTTLTSFETRSVRLRRGFHGYRAEEVDAWIGQVQAFLIARGR